MSITGTIDTGGSRLSFLTPVLGTYYVRVRNVGTSTGAYHVMFTNVGLGSGWVGYP